MASPLSNVRVLDLSRILAGPWCGQLFDLGGPTFAGIAILTHLGGAALAGDLVQSARRMSAAEALARGLYAEILNADDLAARAEQAALLLGSKPAQAFALNKRWLRKPLLEALRRAEQDTRSLRASGVIH